MTLGLASRERGAVPIGGAASGTFQPAPAVCLVERVTRHTVRQDPQAWQRGFEAGEAGRPSGACPYAAESVKAFSWYAGWLEGKAKRLH